MTQFTLGFTEITLTMSAVIALLLLMSKLFGRRFTAKCRYLVWTIVMIRLCVPIGGAFLPSLVEVELPAEVTQSVAETTPVNDPISDRPAGTTPVQNPPVTVAPTVEIGTAETQATLPETQAEEKSPTPTFELPSADIILTVCGYVWLAGAAVFLIIALAKYGVSMRGLRKALKPASSGTYALYEKLCEKQKLRRIPALYVSPLAASPMLCGYFKPRIILPDIELSPNSLAGILTHELTHYRRRDLWVKLLCVFATSLHWFNPLVHIAAKRCNNEMELSCDEAVLAGLDGDVRLSYGKVMLDIIRRCRRPSGTLTTQFNPKKNAVKERFNNILDMTKKKRGLWIIAVVAAVCVIAGAVIGCSIGEKSNVPASEPEAYQEVLHGERTVLDIASGKEMYFSEFVGITEAEQISKFTITDLNGDNKSELVLWLTTDSNEYLGFDILFVDGDTVCCFSLPYRAFNQLKADGTFAFSGGAYDSGIGRLELSGKSYSVDYITFSESNQDNNGDVIMNYFVNRMGADKNEYDEEVLRQAQKQDVTWWDYNSVSVPLKYEQYTAPDANSVKLEASDITQIYTEYEVSGTKLILCSSPGYNLIAAYEKDGAYYRFCVMAEDEVIPSSYSVTTYEKLLGQSGFLLQWGWTHNSAEYYYFDGDTLRMLAEGSNIFETDVDHDGEIEIVSCYNGMGNIYDLRDGEVYVCSPEVVLSDAGIGSYALYMPDDSYSIYNYDNGKNYSGVVFGDSIYVSEIIQDVPTAQPVGTGPFVGYIKDAETDSIDLYTKENGDYIMSIPYAVVEQFPATDRTNPAYTFGRMNADFYCGSIGDFVWAAVCTGTSLSVANNNICTSSDGGKTWTIGDRAALWSSQATGALFISENVGFMTHEYREDFGPDLRRTTDGGTSWQRVAVEIPASMSDYRMTPRALSFDGDSGVCRIEGYDGDGNPLAGVSLVTSDGGMSWTLREDGASTDGYTLLSQDNSMRLYVRGDSTSGGDQSFKLQYTDNDGAEHSFDFSGSGYDITPNSAYSPRIYTTDANGDYWYDIAVVFTTGSGTGVHSEELRLFAGWLDTEIPVTSAVGYLDATLKITSDSNKWTLKHGGKSFDVGKSQFSDYAAADLFDKPTYHQNFCYHVIFDQIYCDLLLCCVGPLTGYANEYLRVGYAYADGSLGGAEVSLRYAEGVTIDVTEETRLAYTDDTGDADHFTLRLTDVDNALLEVTRDEYNIPFAVSFTAEGQTKKFAQAIQLYGNFHIDIFRADGMTVFDKLSYGYGDTYVFHEGGVYTLQAHYSVGSLYSTYLYAEGGRLRFCRQSVQFSQADLVQTGFSAIAQTITSRDDFFRSYGSFSIDSDGNAVYTEDKRQTLSDVYNLDAEYAEFIKLYPNAYPATLDELIAKNSRSVPGGAPQALITYLYNGYLPQGATEILYCQRISMNPYYIVLFRTSPKSVCVYTIWDDLTHYNPVSVVIPDGYDYDSAEAIWAGGRGGSGESQFWVELEKNGVYTYLCYDNYAYTDDLFDYRFDGEVPADELISYAEDFGVPIKFPNTNAPGASAADMNVTITDIADIDKFSLNDADAQYVTQILTGKIDALSGVSFGGYTITAEHNEYSVRVSDWMLRCCKATSERFRSV